MKTWKHLNIEQRKIISSGLAHNDKLVDIAERLEFDPRGISREVRRNRIPIGYPDGTISNITGATSCITCPAGTSPNYNKNECN